MQIDANFPKLQILDEAKCQTLFEASLECLERVGVQLDNPRGREILAKAGAKVEGKLVKIPSDVIIETIETAPRALSIWSRDAESELVVNPESVYFGPGPTCTYFCDPVTGARRFAQRGDAGFTAKVCDALPNLDFLMSLSIYSDVPPELSPVYEYADMVTNSTKPVVAWANDVPTLEAIYKIAAVVAGGESKLQEKSSFAYFSTYHSPLHHKNQQIETMLWAAEHKIPVVYLGGPGLGSDSPVTGASGLVLHLAAALSGLAVVQLAFPGAPMAIGGLLSMMDMFTARPSYGSPETSLFTGAAAELARYLDLPFMGTAGASESKAIDAQAAAEITSQIIFSLLSRAGMVHDVGFLDCADIGSLELLVLADEVISYAKRIMRGAEVNKETIMMDVIARVGPAGHFMAEEESVKLLRKEVWLPKVLDRVPYNQWQQRGALTSEEHVRGRLEEILLNHQPEPLPAEILEKMVRILASEEERVSSN